MRLRSRSNKDIIGATSVSVTHKPFVRIPVTKTKNKKAVKVLKFKPSGTLMSSVDVSSKTKVKDELPVVVVAKKSAPPPVHLCFGLSEDEIGGEQPVDPNLPTPSKETFDKWKMFINAATFHPNILVHSDVRCIRELFGVLGAEIPFEHSNLMVEFEEFDGSERSVVGRIESDSHKMGHSLEVLKPAIQHEEELPFNNIEFADVTELEVMPSLDVVIVRDYCFTEELKTALAELVEMVLKYPESILYPDYNFLYEFLLRFGVKAEVITQEIYGTQIRRLQNKIPASSLLLKQGEPEVEIGFEEKEKINVHNDIMSLHGSIQSYQIRRDSRLGSGNSGTDSGFSSMDPNDSSEDDFEEESSDEEEESADEEEDEGVMFDDGIPQGRGKRRLRQPDTVMRTPFKCTVCANRYAFKSNCNRHIMKCHPGAKIHPVRQNMCNNPEFIPPFFCSVCKKGFSGKDTCKTHIRKFHSKLKNAHPILNPAAKINVPKPPPVNEILFPSKLCYPLVNGTSDDKVANNCPLLKSSANSHEEKHVFNESWLSAFNFMSRNSVVTYNEKSLLANFAPLMEDLNCYVLLQKDF